MSTNVAEESRRIKEIVVRIDGNAQFSDSDLAETLDTLEQFECWGPYFRLLRRRLNDSKLRTVEDYIKLAKVQNQNLEDVFAAAETASNLVADQKISYQELTETVIPRIIDFEDFAAEAAVLSAVCDRFNNKIDRVRCLERLCMLYEKRTHNETQLLKSYEDLLNTDQKNIKALRFFKLIHTQNSEWEDVVDKLGILLEAVSHPMEIYRYAQELAAVYLYQMDRPRDAIKVIETYCSDSPLDTSMILYDAYQLSNDSNGCLQVLRGCIIGVNDDISRSTLHFKIAEIHEQLKQFDLAIENFEKSHKLRPDFLDPVEGIIAIYAINGDWPKLQKWMKKLHDVIGDEKLKIQLNQAVRRIDDGIAAGK